MTEMAEEPVDFEGRDSLIPSVELVFWRIVGREIMGSHSFLYMALDFCVGHQPWFDMDGGERGHSLTNFNSRNLIVGKILYLSSTYATFGCFSTKPHPFNFPYATSQPFL